MPGDEPPGPVHRPLTELWAVCTCTLIRMFLAFFQHSFLCLLASVTELGQGHGWVIES